MYTETLRVLGLWADLDEATLARLDDYLAGEQATDWNARRSGASVTPLTHQLAYGRAIIAATRALHAMLDAAKLAGSIY